MLCTITMVNIIIIIIIITTCQDDFNYNHMYKQNGHNRYHNHHHHHHNHYLPGWCEKRKVSVVRPLCWKLKAIKIKLRFRRYSNTTKHNKYITITNTNNHKKYVHIHNAHRDRGKCHTIYIGQIQSNITNTNNKTKLT